MKNFMTQKRQGAGIIEYILLGALAATIIYFVFTKLIMPAITTSGTNISDTIEGVDIKNNKY